MTEGAREMSLRELVEALPRPVGADKPTHCAYREYEALVEALEAIIERDEEGDYSGLQDVDAGERPGPSPYQSAALTDALDHARAALASQDTEGGVG